MCVCVRARVRRKLLCVHLATLSEWSTNFSHTYICERARVCITMFTCYVCIYKCVYVFACVRRASQRWQLLPVDISSVIMRNNFAFSDISTQSSAISSRLTILANTVRAFSICVLHLCICVCADFLTAIIAQYINAHLNLQAGNKCALSLFRSRFF